MPAFLTFFSKRDSQKGLRKSQSSPQQSIPSTPTSIPPSSTKSGVPSPSIADASEQLEGSELSLETEYILADAELSPVNSHNHSVYPLSSNVASTSTTKLKMPFRRRQPALAPTNLTSSTPVPPMVPPKEPHKYSVDSSVSVSTSLLPPPSRSAIFGSYADPHNALSTRSLPQRVPAIHPPRRSHDVPQDYETMSNPDSHTTIQTKQTNKGGLFSWARARGRTKSKAPLPDPDLHSPPVLSFPPTDSFNLKAFRHVTSPSPGTPPSGSSSDRDPLPRPRQRGDSFTSEASQRISVAAFREAQARRSTANSPVPSLPADRESFPSTQVGNHRRSAFVTPPPVLKAGSQARPTLLNRPPTRSPPARSSTAPLSFAISMTTSSEEEEEEEESESEEEATLRPTRKRTITSRSAQSEVGFRSSPALAYTRARSDTGHGHSSGGSARPSPSPRNKANNAPTPGGSGIASRSSSVYSRKRASLSTPALLPDAAMKRGAAVPRYAAAGSPSCFSRFTRINFHFQSQNQRMFFHVRSREPRHLLNRLQSRVHQKMRRWRPLYSLRVREVRRHVVPDLVTQQSHLSISKSWWARIRPFLRALQGHRNHPFLLPSPIALQLDIARHRSDSESDCRR